MSSFLSDEIASQPREVESFLRRHTSEMFSLARALPKCDYALVAARGTSDHAATYARYVLGSLAGLPVAPAAPSLHTLYKTPPRLNGALVIGISQSGQSPDVVSVVEEARRQGRPSLGFTNDPESPLGKTCDHVFRLCDSPERAVAATKTYTTQLTGMALLGAAMARSATHLDELERLPAALNDVLEGAREPARVAAAELSDATSFLTLARGINLCTADELGLKLRELLCMPTHGWSAADFRHGSIALVAPGRRTDALLIMPRGVGFKDMQDLADEIVRRGGSLTVISDVPSPVAHPARLLPMAASVGEWLSPMTSVVPGQLLALEMVHARGLDPDKPAGLPEKVVKTL